MTKLAAYLSTFFFGMAFACALLFFENRWEGNNLETAVRSIAPATDTHGRPIQELDKPHVFIYNN